MVLTLIRILLSTKQDVISDLHHQLICQVQLIATFLVTIQTLFNNPNVIIFGTIVGSKVFYNIPNLRSEILITPYQARPECTEKGENLHKTWLWEV